MPRILHIDSSARRDGSLTRQLGREFVDLLVEADPASTVVYRDVSHEPISHVENNWVAGNFAPPDVRSVEQAQALRLSDRLVDELLAADVLVAGVPVYNFGVPAAFKAYVDQIVRTDRTFRYTPEGPEGLVAGKRAYVVGASASSAAQLTAWGMNYHEPYLRTILGFIGIRDVHVVSAGGRDPDTVARTTAEVRAELRRLAAAYGAGGHAADGAARAA